MERGRKKDARLARDYGDMPTPGWMVNDMLDACDALESHANVISNPDTSLLDLCCGDGNFLMEALRRRLEHADTPLQAMHGIYGVELQQQHVDMARRRCMDMLHDAYGNEACEEGAVDAIIHSHIVVGDALSFAPQGHYDVIVSTPPYQDNIAGKTHVRNRSKSLPIYQEFWDKALSMSPNVMAFIIPAKWYAGGWGLDDFRKEMLADRHIVRLSDYRTSEQIFGDDVQVNGGICWIVRDADATTDTPRITTHDASGSVTYDGQRLLTVPRCPILLRDEQSFSIVRKACECKDRIGLGSVSDSMMGTTPFGLPASVDGFEHHDVRNDASDVDVLCIKRRHVFAPRKSITRRTSDIDKWQVAVQLCHNQYDANPMSETVLLPPSTACTHSCVCTESFDDSSEAMAMKSYMDTHVFRYLVSLAKISPIGTRRIYALVPMLPMTHEWDDESVAKTLRLTDDELTYAIECIQRNNI